MNRFIRLATVLFLFCSFIFITSCEEDTMANPDILISDNIDITGGQEVPPVSTVAQATWTYVMIKVQNNLTLPSPGAIYLIV